MNRRKKNSRLRGSHTHGWGSKKKHRGAGNRGGRGNAGTGKRGDAKKPSRWKTQPMTGRSGFTSVKAVNTKVKCINLKELQDQLSTLVAAKKAEEKGGVYTVDLSKLGVSKLLGRGSVTTKLSINVNSASAKAVAKVQEAGGEVQTRESD